MFHIITWTTIAGLFLPFTPWTVKFKKKTLLGSWPIVDDDGEEQHQRLGWCGL